MTQNKKIYSALLPFWPIALISLALVFFLALNKTKKIELPKKTGVYPIHKDIITTVFWVGEEASDDNGQIANDQSAWDENWQENYGGVDDVENRDGYLPSGFIPKENPFYFALPYNDINDQGERRKNAPALVYWANEKTWPEEYSMLKNQWIKISKGGKTAYAQWEDAGPYYENDADYVFGNAAPKNKTSPKAGLDVSPAVKSYLGLSDTDKTDWQFIRESEVPGGPWKEIITVSHPENK